MTTSKDLNKKINAFMKGEKTKRETLQELIVACIEHAKANGNSFDCLSNLIRQGIELRSRNWNAIRQYIGEHVQGISWQKAKDGSFMYKVSGDVVYKDIEYPWYNAAGQFGTSNNKEVSAAALIAYFKSLGKRMDENGVKAEDREKIERLMQFAQTTLEA